MTGLERDFASQIALFASVYLNPLQINTETSFLFNSVEIFGLSITKYKDNFKGRKNLEELGVNEVFVLTIHLKHDEYFNSTAILVFYSKNIIN
jgi:hypothetical protein